MCEKPCHGTSLLKCAAVAVCHNITIHLNLTAVTGCLCFDKKSLLKFVIGFCCNPAPSDLLRRYKPSLTRLKVSRSQTDSSGGLRTTSRWCLGVLTLLHWFRHLKAICKGTCCTPITFETKRISETQSHQSNALLRQCFCWCEFINTNCFIHTRRLTEGSRIQTLFRDHFKYIWCISLAHIMRSFTVALDMH